jgi:formate dehydrogenase major subunit
VKPKASAQTPSDACKGLRAAVKPAGEAKPDWWIVSQIGKRMGMQGFEYESAKEVFNELCEVSSTYHGLDWDRIEYSKCHL